MRRWWDSVGGAHTHCNALIVAGVEAQGRRVRGATQDAAKDRKPSGICTVHITNMSQYRYPDAPPGLRCSRNEPSRCNSASST